MDLLHRTLTRKICGGFRKLFKSAADLRDVHVQQDLTRAWACEMHVFFSGYYNTLKQQERPARRKFAAFLRKFDLDREAARNTHSSKSLHDVGTTLKRPPESKIRLTTCSNNC